MEPFDAVRGSVVLFFVVVIGILVLFIPKRAAEETAKRFERGDS